MDDIISVVILPTYFVFTLALVAVAYYILQRRLEKARADMAQMMKRIDQNLALGVKLLEVRNYYQETSAQLKKMLDEAYKEGNRFRQDQIRKMTARLDTLKTRTVDKTLRILDTQAQPRKSNRRRRSRRPRGHEKTDSSTKASPAAESHTKDA